MYCQPATLPALVNPLHPPSRGADAAIAGSTQQLHKSLWILDAQSPNNLSSLLETEKKNLSEPSKYAHRISFDRWNEKGIVVCILSLKEKTKRLSGGFTPGVTSIFSLDRKQESAGALP